MTGGSLKSEGDGCAGCCADQSALHAGVVHLNTDHGVSSEEFGTLAHLVDSIFKSGLQVFLASFASAVERFQHSARGER